ncbi:hypothetical protein NL676_030994 [Syzygium grande]|nr:hypothetical protein NL676_030994 [Syzygium grande]
MKVLAFASISWVFFYLGKHWSESDDYGQHIFFSLPPPPPPPLAITRFRIVDENGMMTDNFEVGELDPEFVDEGTNNAIEIEIEIEGTEGEKNGMNVRVQKYEFFARRV